MAVAMGVTLLGVALSVGAAWGGGGRGSGRSLAGGDGLVDGLGDPDEVLVFGVDGAVGGHGSLGAGVLDGRGGLLFGGIGGLVLGRLDNLGGSGLGSDVAGLGSRDGRLRNNGSRLGAVGVAVLAGASTLRGVAGGGDLVASRQFVEGTENVFGDLDTLLALLLSLDGLELKNVAVFDVARVVGASIDGLAEDILIPSVHKVSVIAVTGGITGGEHKLTLESRLDVRVDIPDNLKEQSRQAVLETLRADISRLDKVGVANVRLVVGRVAVLAIPARGEDDLSAETGLASHLLGDVLAAKSILRLLVVVEAVPADTVSSLLRLVEPVFLSPATVARIVGLPSRIRELTETRVASNHAKVWREDLQLLVVRSLQVVDKHATGVLELLELSILHLPVQRRHPVRRLVSRSSTSSALRLAEIVVLASHRELVGTVNGMDVSTDNILSIDGIDTLVGEGSSARQAEESIRFQSEQRSRQQKILEHHREGVVCCCRVNVASGGRSNGGSRIRLSE